MKDKIVFKLSLIMCLIIHCSNIKCLYISYASGKKKILLLEFNLFLKVIASNLCDIICQPPSTLCVDD